MGYYNVNKIKDTDIKVRTLTEKRYKELIYIEHDYLELANKIKELNAVLNALEIFRGHDLKEQKDIEEI